jgi:hypothetical protein
MRKPAPCKGAGFYLCMDAKYRPVYGAFYKMIINYYEIMLDIKIEININIDYIFNNCQLFNFYKLLYIYEKAVEKV